MPQASGEDQAGGCGCHADRQGLGGLQSRFEGGRGGGGVIPGRSMAPKLSLWGEACVGQCKEDLECQAHVSP